MPYVEREIERLYYKIGDAAEMVGVAPSCLRYWETEFHIEAHHRNGKGERKYTVPQVALFKLIGEALEDLHIATVNRLLDEGGEERLQEVVDSLKRKQ